LASISFMTACTAIVQVLAGPEYRGRVLAIQSMVFLGSTPIGGPVIGWVSDAAGPRIGLLIGALACAAAAVVGVRALQVSAARTADPGAGPAVIEGEGGALAD